MSVFLALTATVADPWAHRDGVVIEKSTTHAPIFGVPVSDDESPVKVFTSLPQRCLSILGPRRVPRIQCPAQSTDIAISVCTSVGFRKLELKDYIEAAEKLRPDVVASLADIADADRVSLKRMAKMADRTHAWLRDTLESRRDGPTTHSLLATVLPLDMEQQQLYLSDMSDEYRSRLSGLILHEPETASAIPERIQHLPRFCASDPANPHGLLRAVALGVDLVTVPFVNAITEQGIAFSFDLLNPSPDSQILPLDGREPMPLGVDMWSASHASEVSPLSPGCTCYTCTRHHRAYLHHLLQAKEMLAWTLLQIHNYHVLDRFFSAIRNSIKAGTFASDHATFSKYYEAEFMAGEGKERGPRLRGYQIKSVGRGEDRKREKVWGRFEDSNATSGAQSPSAAGVENDQARKVIEAVETGAAVGQEPDVVKARAMSLEASGLAKTEGERKSE